MKKRILSLLLALLMLVGMVPASAFAEGTDYASHKGGTAVFNAQQNSTDADGNVLYYGTAYIFADPNVEQPWNNTLSFEGLMETVFVIDEVYVEENVGVWYKLSAAAGSTLPDAMTTMPWVFQNDLPTPMGIDTLVVTPPAVEPECGCCENCTGAEGCTCGCENCQFAEKEEPEVVPSVTDPATNTVIYADSIPTGVTAVVDTNADVSSQLEKYGIPAANVILGWDISMKNADNTEYQPVGGAIVKVPVNAPAGKMVGILHTHDGITTFGGLTRILTDGTIEFYTGDFSEFLVFTVDFHYNGTDYSIAGKSSILLSELFEAMHILEDAFSAASVVFSNDELVLPVRQDDGDWLLTSLEPFQTEESLIVTFNDGRTIVIDVTDDVASHTCCEPRGVNDAWTADERWDKVDFSIGWNIFDGVPGVNGHWSVWGGGEHNCTIKLYNSNGHVANSFFGHSPLRDGWLTLSGSYWYRVTDLSLGASSATTHREGTSTLRLGYMGNSEDNWFFDPTDNWLEVYMEPLDIWDDGSHCNIDQVSKFAEEDEWGNRTVVVYAYDVTTSAYKEVGRRSVLFPTFETISTSDLNVTAYPGWQVADKKASGSTYEVYLSPISYTVVYNGNGATSGSTASSTHYYGTAKALTANGFSRTGYTFGGWAKTATGTAEYSDKQSVLNLTTTNNGTVNLYVYWNPITYKVTLNNQSATTAGTANYWYKYNTVINNVYYYTDSGCTTALANSTITKPTKTGYTFKGYYTGTDGSGTQYVNENGLCVNNLYKSKAENTTLYAYWTPNTNTKYTVETYTQNIADNNYTKSTETKTGTTGNTATVSTTAPTGFTYNASKSTVSGTIAADGSLVLKVYFDRNSYTVTTNKGTGISAVTGAGTYKYGASVTIGATVSTGYTWKNWTSGATQVSANQSYTFEMPASNVTYTANATPSTNTAYKVNHYIENLAGTDYTKHGDTENKTGTTNATLTLANLAKTIEGFTYKEGKVGGNVATTTTILPDGTRVIDLYYTRNSYEVKLNKGTGIASVTGANTYKYGASVTIGATVAEGYTWKNWTSGTTQVSASQSYTFEMPASNVTYTANAAANTYKVHFDGNGATDGSMSDQNFAYGTAQALSTNAYKRAFTVSYDTDGGTAIADATATATFNGWATTAAGAKAYDDKQSVSNLTSTNNATVNLYAKWTDGSVTLPADPTKDRYDFKGWYTDKAFTEAKKVTGTTYTPTSNVTFYAKWEKKAESKVTVIYNPAHLTTESLEGFTKVDGEDNTWEKMVPTDSTITLTFTPKAGYQITSVLCNDETMDDGADGSIPDYKVEADTTFTLTSDVITYTITYNHNDVTTGEPTTSTASYTIEDALTLAEAPTREGYKFTGWKLEDADGTSWTAGTFQAAHTMGTGKYGDVTFVAQWERQTGDLRLTYAGSGPAIVTVTGENLDITLVMDKSVTVTDLPTGTYSVAVQGASATTTVTVSNASPKIEDGETTEVTVTVGNKDTGWFTGFSRKINKFNG